mmetsp:Transcript_1550/g.1843  ORF Transcript_1550/g.1843 Transcript_1550/m.1843 type:complete len:92 (-) Transcript_1550:110-385(-)
MTKLSKSSENSLKKPKPGAKHSKKKTKQYEDWSKRLRPRKSRPNFSTNKITKSKKNKTNLKEEPKEELKKESKEESKEESIMNHNLITEEE